MYLKHAKISRNKQKKLIEHFIAGTTARTAAELALVHRNTATKFYHKLRKKIAAKQEERSKKIGGEIELDESYFGGRRKGKRGRGAKGKVPVFGILKRGGDVYTKVLTDTKKASIIPVIIQKICPDSIVYTDEYAVYDSLDVSGFKHYRINHSKLFSNQKTHINGIENFWNQAKRHLRKFNGIPKNNFHLFLKECEWRFNIGTPKELLKDLKKMLKN